MSKWGEGSGHAEGSKKTQFPHQKNQSIPWQPGFYPGGGRKKIWTEEKIMEEGMALLEWMENPKNFYMYQFATERGYVNSKFADFCRDSEDFKDIYQRALDWQENKIIQLGMLKKLDNQMTKMVLINKHRWFDKTETVVTGTQNLRFLLDDVDGKTKDLVDEDRYSESSEGETPRPELAPE